MFNNEKLLAEIARRIKKGCAVPVKDEFCKVVKTYLTAQNIDIKTVKNENGKTYFLRNK
ncbi:MAG: hypothetical protein LBT46_15245 [Planctomycetaceae bacterium]|jgi:hypothetical protein|nr:hypothetical protein [Planctomycetaceae bacterium]